MPLVSSGCFYPGTIQSTGYFPCGFAVVGEGYDDLFQFFGMVVCAFANRLIALVGFVSQATEFDPSDFCFPQRGFGAG